MRIATAKVVEFHKILTNYYYQSGRHDMLWRQPDKDGSFDPYKILVSELMLQQTQVERVTPKYQEFLQTFPTVQKLAQAELSEVLKLWNGLGYNRRAKYIWQAAQMVVTEFDGQFPETIDALRKIPGVGPNTAGAIMAYAYDQPTLFIETNIRTVIIYHFFTGKSDIDDNEILEVLKATAPHPNDSKRAMQGAALIPRQFYWAMMDYGSFLKQTVGNLSRSSKHYTKQPTFHGSKRQLRGRVIKLLAPGPMALTTLQTKIIDERLGEIIDALIREELIVRDGNKVRLS